MSNKDAAMFPIIASCTLFGIYIFFQVSSLSTALLYVWIAFEQYGPTMSQPAMLEVLL